MRGLPFTLLLFMTTTTISKFYHFLPTTSIGWELMRSPFMDRARSRCIETLTEFRMRFSFHTHVYRSFRWQVPPLMLIEKRGYVITCVNTAVSDCVAWTWQDDSCQGGDIVLTILTCGLKGIQ